jgi:peptidoglycan/xylan/chitin deacetylase (PgdA/CDA1 family)
MNRLTWKRGLGQLWGRFSPAHPRKLILLYHSLGANPPAVSIANFRQQVAWLAQNAAITSLDSVMRAVAQNSLQIAITFDDGYASLHDQVAPILAEYGATATVYLNTGWIGESGRKASDADLGHYPKEHFLTWGDVEELASAGWTIGSHGVEHLDLTRQDADAVARELADSKHEIQFRLGQVCRHFAYTWGRFTPTLQQAVRNVGYTSAVSGMHGPVTTTSDIYALPRMDIRTEYELCDFVDVVKGHWDYLGLKQRLARKLA